MDFKLRSLITDHSAICFPACGCSDHGQCDEGITGSGQCLCEAGWAGRFCDTQAGRSWEGYPPAAPGCSGPCRELPAEVGSEPHLDKKKRQNSRCSPFMWKRWHGYAAPGLRRCGDLKEKLMNIFNSMKPVCIHGRTPLRPRMQDGAGMAPRDRGPGPRG